MLTPGVVILALKILVAAVTVLLVASLVALAIRRPRWHGRLNTVFFILTATTVLAFEVIVRFIRPDLTAGFTDEQREALSIHLGFAVPSAILLPVMLYSGLRQYKTAHLVCASVFVLLWAGTFITGIFFLPHSFDPIP